MTRFLALTAVLGFLAFALAAQTTDWQLRSGDSPLSPQDAAAQLVGQTLTFYDDGRSKYSEGGAYSYTYSEVNGGSSAFGVFRIEADGSICVDYRNGFSRCDLYVRNGSRLILITEDGDRYPVRPGWDTQ